MKKVIILAACLFAAGYATAQKLDAASVPAAVKESFAKKYPGAKPEKWEKEGADFEAEFDLNKVESSAVFGADGMFKELEQEIKQSELPAGVASYCEKNFTGYKLKEAAKITDASGKVQYEAEMSKGKEHFDALFDTQGGFVKKGAASISEEKD